jgi:hypothetical protein
MGNGTNVNWLDTQTRNLSDAELEAAIAGVIQIRNLRNRATAEVQQLARATRGVSLRQEFGPKDPGDDLYQSYRRAGMTHGEAEKRIRDLR